MNKSIDVDLKCAGCKKPADMIVEYDRGCFCRPNARHEPLCIQHYVKSTPLGWIEIVEVLPGPWEQHIKEKFFL